MVQPRFGFLILQAIWKRPAPAILSGDPVSGHAGAPGGPAAILSCSRPFRLLCSPGARSPFIVLSVDELCWPGYQAQRRSPGRFCHGPQ